MSIIRTTKQILFGTVAGAAALGLAPAAGAQPAPMVTIGPIGPIGPVGPVGPIGPVGMLRIEPFAPASFEDRAD